MTLFNFNLLFIIFSTVFAAHNLFFYFIYILFYYYCIQIYFCASHDLCLFTTTSYVQICLICDVCLFLFDIICFYIIINLVNFCLCFFWVLHMFCQCNFIEISIIIIFFDCTWSVIFNVFIIILMFVYVAHNLC